MRAAAKRRSIKKHKHCTGTLDGKAVSCKDAACCEHWILHRFRKTFATMHHANGVPARTFGAGLVELVQD
jgi:hypothetical protein